MLSIIPPKDLRNNLLWRAFVRRRGDDSKRDRARILEKCANDLIWWIDSFCWQVNPKHVGREIGPFITWKFQQRLLKKTCKRLFGKRRGDILWEKSREMGATWLAIISAVWLCLFHKNKRVIFISHSEKAVYEAGNDGTLFAKVQFILDSLPDWMKEGVERRKLAYNFPGRSNISGLASTERSGVGDRVTFVLLDEFSKQRDGYKIWGQTADTGPRLVIGTHYGVSGCFYDLSQRNDMTKSVLHWTQHPEKKRGLYRSTPGGHEIIDTRYRWPAEFKFVRDGRPFGGPHPGIRSPWYDEECRRRAHDRDVAQHLDIAPAQSQANYFDALMIQSLQECTKDPIWRGSIQWDSGTGDPLGLRKDADGPISLWLTPLGDNELPPGRYGMGADVSQGVGSSNSVLSVGDVRTGRKVCEVVTSELDPRDFAMVSVALGRLLKDYDGTQAMIAWETAGPGGLYGRTLKAMGYTRFFYRERNDMMRGYQVSDIAGWNPSVAGAKRNLLDQYTIALRDRTFQNLSYHSFEDCKKYRFSDVKDTVEHPLQESGPDPSGARSNHGDRVIADALCVMVMRKLGLGKVEQLPEESDVPPVIGTLEWRMSLHKQTETRSRGKDLHPVRRRR